MARSCCSNWLVRQASNVRCPELCGRGASLVDQQPAVARDEELDAQDADVVERVHHARASRRPPAPPSPRARRAGATETSRMWRTCAFSIGPKCDHSPSTPRAPITEISRSRSTKRFEHRFAASERVPGGGELVRLVDRDLPLAVVAERRRLQHRRTADRLQRRRRDRRRCATAANGATGRPCVGEKRLLAEAMLRDRQRAAVRPDDRVRSGRGRGRRRHVLELEGDDVDALREGADRVEVVVRAR